MIPAQPQLRRHPAPRGLRWRPLTLAMSLALALWSGPPSLAQAGDAAGGEPSAWRLPALGDAVSDEFDLFQERRLGDRIMRDLHRDPDLIDDPVLQAYVEQPMRALLGAARASGGLDPDMDRAFAWEPFLVRDRSVNAFALPGGYIGVYLGLIGLTTTPDELASVMAHELTHITQRHIARSQSNASQQSAAALAAMLLGVVAAAKTNSLEGLQASVMGGQALMAQGQLNFSRDMEREADRIGLELMGGAGYGARGMTQMFEKLDNSSRLNDNGLYPYLRSHPLTSERISEARLRASRTDGQALFGHLGEHQLMQARARVLMDTREPSLRRLQAMDQAQPPLADLPRLGALYGAVLASIKLRELPRAERAWQDGERLIRQAFSKEPQVLRDWTLLRVELLTQWVAATPQGAEQVQRLLDTLRGLTGVDGRPEMLARAQAALALAADPAPDSRARLRTATETLQTWVAEHPRDALAWQTLSQCAEPLGLQLRALRAGAEAAWARGDLQGAVDRFRAAQAAARNAAADQYVEASIIESRLRAVELERRRAQAEARGERAD